MNKNVYYKRFILILGVFALVATVVCLVILNKGDYGNDYNDGYNENPDLTKKVVGSKNAMADRKEIETVDDIVWGSDLIIVGEVLDDGVEDVHNRYGYGGSAEKDAEELIELGGNPYIPCTISEVKVVEVIEGDAEVGSIIQLFQLGEPKTLDYQTKVRKGERLVMVLIESGRTDKPNMYYSLDLEHTMFYVDKKSKITSMSDEMICARYDGLSKDRLKKDLEESFKNRGRRGKGKSK